MVFFDYCKRGKMTDSWLVYIDVDQLVTIKGLMIRTSPVIPDMKEGKLGKDWKKHGH